MQIRGRYLALVFGGAAACVAAEILQVDSSCGPSVCAANEYCCNESCGICSPLDGTCTQQQCDVYP